MPIIKSPVTAVLSNKNLTLEMVLSVAMTLKVHLIHSIVLMSSPVSWVFDACPAT